MGLFDWMDDESLEKEMAKSTSPEAIMDFIVNNYTIDADLLEIEDKSALPIVNYPGSLTLNPNAMNLTNGYFQWGRIGGVLDCHICKSKSIKDKDCLCKNKCVNMGIYERLYEGELRELPESMILNKRLRLYRGISVNENDVEDVINDIKTNGVYQSPKQRFTGVWKDVRSVCKDLFLIENLSSDMTSPLSLLNNETEINVDEHIGSCFADNLGAVDYATKRNITGDKTIPLLISVDVDINDVAIDGRDFLYSAFRRLNDENIFNQTRILKDIFGPKIEYYIEKVIKNPQSDRYAICDLVICDNDIIYYHYNNQSLINGRYKTMFKSAFFVKTPIETKDVISVEIVNESEEFLMPVYNIYEF